MSSTMKKIKKIVKDRDLERADTDALVIALSNLEVAAAIESQEKRLKDIDSRLDGISRTLLDLLKVYHDFESAKGRQF